MIKTTATPGNHIIMIANQLHDNPHLFNKFKSDIKQRTERSAHRSDLRTPCGPLKKQLFLKTHNGFSYYLLQCKSCPVPICAPNATEGWVRCQSSTVCTRPHSPEKKQARWVKTPVWIDFGYLRASNLQNNE